MSFLGELYQTGFLNIRRLACMAMAKRKHGNNLCFLLHYAAAYYGDKPALSDGTTTVSFKELYRSVLNCSSSIKEQTQAGSDATIILVTGNTLRHIIASYAIQNLGMRLVLVNAKAHPAEIQQIRDKQQGACFIIAHMPSVAGTILLERLFDNKARAKEMIFRKHAPVIYTTSGTTGTAKMIEKRKGAFYWLRSFTDLITYTGIHRRSAVFIAVPVSHGFGSTALLFALVLGKKAVIGGTLGWAQQAAIMQKENTDLLAGVPAALYYLANIMEGPNPVKLVISGGAPLTPAVLQKVSSRFGTNIFSMYGSTEASTSFIANYDALEKNIYTLGRPLKNVQYKLQPIDKGGKELLIKSGLANTTSPVGWLSTGDMVCTDETGVLYWCGRKDDMIIKGGVNIYPAEIEESLLKVDGVEEAFVCGADNSIKGQAIIAYVQVKNGAQIPEAALKEHLRQTLSGIKIPDTITFVKAFNYTSTGKKIRPASLTGLDAK